MFKGLATGIGSLPHTDPREAVDLVLRYLPQAPFWPQLPKKSRNEGAIEQFSENLPLAGLEQGALPDKLEEFYEKIISQDLEYFKISEDYACGLYEFKKKLIDNPSIVGGIEFIKGQVTGPFTFAASIKNKEGKALLHDPTMMQMVIKALAMKALWQVEFFKIFGKKTVIFIDEPYLGCFGSAYTPINRVDVIKGLSELLEGLNKEDALAGVHCCGNTDWSIFTEVPGLKIINFDAFNFLDKFTIYSENLKGYLEQGGMICWGIVPTLEFSSRHSPGVLLERLQEGIDSMVKKGISRELILKNLIISPACGLGALESGKAAGILEALARISSLIKESL